MCVTGGHSFLTAQLSRIKSILSNIASGRILFSSVVFHTSFNDDFSAWVRFSYAVLANFHVRNSVRWQRAGSVVLDLYVLNLRLVTFRNNHLSYRSEEERFTKHSCSYLQVPRNQSADLNPADASNEFRQVHQQFKGECNSNLSAYSSYRHLG